MKTKRIVINNATGDSRIDEAEPICGEGYCEDCGACLKCDGNTDCWPEGAHRWIVYEDGEVIPSADLGY